MSQGNAIATFIAKSSGFGELTGLNLFEEAQIDQWLNFSKQVLESNSRANAQFVFGSSKLDSKEAVSALKEAAKAIDK